jgi:peptide/nickel transport system substrate-binding protein
MTRRLLALALGALLFAALPGAVHAQKKTLTIALNQDPDVLDPTLSRTYVGRIVFAQMCEKLYEIDEQLRILPQLAAGMPAVSDGGKTVTIKLRREFNETYLMLPGRPLLARPAGRCRAQSQECWSR